MSRKPEDSEEAKGLIEDPNEEKPVKVSLEEPASDLDDDDDDEPAPQPAPVAAKQDGAQPRDRATGRWAQKKAERQQQWRERREREKAAEREQITNMIRQEREFGERRYNELRAEFDRIRQQGGKPADPVSSELADVQTAIKQELDLFETKQGHPVDRYNQLRAKEIALISKQALAEALAEREKNNPTQQQRQNPYAAREPFIEAEFPWTKDARFSDLNSKAWHYRNYLINVEGRPDTIETDREALSHVAAKFGAEYGLRQPARPTQRTRELYGAPPSRNYPDRNPAPREVEIPRHLTNGTGLSMQQLADAVRLAMNDE